MREFIKIVIIIAVILFGGLFLAGFIQKSLGASSLDQLQSELNATSGAVKTAITDGITFEYPRSWVFIGKENRFTSIIATLNYKINEDPEGAVIAMEHYSSQEPASITLNEIKETLLKPRVLNPMMSNTTIFEEGMDKYIINGHPAPYVIATLTASNIFGYSQNLVIMVIVIQLENNDKDGVWIRYVTDENHFDELLPTVEQIIQSIKPVN